MFSMCVRSKEDVRATQPYSKEFKSDAKHVLSSLSTWVKLQVTVDLIMSL